MSSEIKVNSIKGAAASTAAITVHNTDGTATGKFTNLPGRNLIINGSMQVAQRGTSDTANGYKTVDRWNTEIGGHDELATREQVAVTSGGAYDAGFRQALKITNGNQTSGADAGDYMAIYQPLEAQNVAQSGWNYVSSSSDITLSFWIKASVAKTYYFYIATVDGTKQIYPMETGSLTADTWTKVTKTIPGATNNTIDNNNGAGLELMIWPYIGTSYTDAGVSLNTWAAYAGGTRTPVDATSWWTTNDATLEITGVQLEVGDTATDFEHRSYGDELQRCLRYYWKDKATDAYKAFTTGANNSASNYYGQMDFPVPMRGTGSGIALSYNALGDFRYYSAGSGKTPTTISINSTRVNQYGAEIFIQDTSAGLTAGNAGWLRAENTSAYIAFDSEL